MDKLFDQNGDIIKEANAKKLGELIILTEEDTDTDISSDDYPF